MNNTATFDPTDEHRSIFDWIVWLLIHLALIGGIIVIGFWTYTTGLATWVSASAFIAGIVAMYLFAKLVPGETLMKIILYLVAAANAGYLAYNGAQELGVNLFNQAQSQKYSAAAKEAANTKNRAARRDVLDRASKDTGLVQAFGGWTSIIAGGLAFLELAVALIVFAISSRRVAKVRKEYQEANGIYPTPPEPARPQHPQQAAQPARSFLSQFRPAAQPPSLSPVIKPAPATAASTSKPLGFAPPAKPAPEPAKPATTRATSSRSSAAKTPLMRRLARKKS